MCLLKYPNLLEFENDCYSHCKQVPHCTLELFEEWHQSLSYRLHESYTHAMESLLNLLMAWVCCLMAIVVLWCIFGYLMAKDEQRFLATQRKSKLRHPGQ